MAEHFYIKTENGTVEVSQEVHRTFYRMSRQERTQMEKLLRNGVRSYDALVEMGLLQEASQDNLEDRVIRQELYQQLHRAIDSLPEAERALILAIYFEGLTEREYAQRISTSQPNVNKRRHKAILHLRKFLEEFC